jgi:hypothetical protein
MAAGYVTITCGNGNGGTFTARFWSSDGTTGGLLFPAPVLTDRAGNELGGVQGTGSTYDPPTGGAGMLGYLSGLWKVANDPTPASVTPVPSATANGLTSTRVVSGATTNAANLKATPGNIWQMHLYNVAAYDVFVKLYEKATAPTVGTDTPKWTIPLKAGGSFGECFLFGKSFATGIAMAITKLQADSDTTVIAAGDVTGSLDWI